MKLPLKIMACLCSCLTLTFNSYSSYAVTFETTDFYQQWKDKYLVQNPYSDETQFYVWYSGEKYSDTNSETPVTVSEAHGYGMLITASMADSDSSAHEIFDGMYRFYKDHTSEIGKNLMAWQQFDNGTAITDGSGADSASDGDIDIAYALLIADSIWGSDGEINYRQSAVDMINDIMKYEVNKTDWLIQLGDWVYGTDENDKYYSAIRSSDFIVQYMPVFAEYTNDDRWLKVYDSTYEIISQYTEKYNTGLLPDFMIKNSDGEFVPAPANFLESEDDGNYSYNSCRTPWRIGMDYLINQNDTAAKYAETLSNFFKSSSKGDPWNIMAGYTPEGIPTADYNDLCFVAPVLISASCTDDSEWHDSIRETLIEYGDDVYFGDTIKMLCLIIDDGCWNVPNASNNIIMGDVNSDGVFNIADIVSLQGWLLNDGTKLKNWKAGDFDNNNQINIFDVCTMKSKLLK